MFKGQTYGTQLVGVNTYMNVIRNTLKQIAFNLLDQRKQRGYHLLNDLKFYSQHYPIQMIFDVGANIGQTVDSFKIAFPKAHIEAFEPVSSTFAQLTRNCMKYDDVVLHNIALGSTLEQKEIFLTMPSEQNSVLNSVLEKDKIHKNNTETLQIKTLEHICTAQQIDSIDLQ